MTPEEAAIEAMHEVTGPVIAIVLVLVAVFVPDRLPRRPRGRTVPPVRGDDLDCRGDLGRRRADADAGAVRAAAEAGTSAIAASSRRSTAASWLTQRYTAGVAFSGARRVGMILFAGMVALAGLLARRRRPSAGRGPGLLHRRGHPARRRVAGPDRRWSVAGGAASQRPIDRRRSRWSAWTSSAAASQASAATMFFPLKPWEERNQSRAAIVGESFMKTGGIKEACCWPSVRPRSRDWARPADSSSTCRTRAKAASGSWRNCCRS